MSKKITIIGGGIVGLVQAYYLVKENYHVTVIDKDEFGMGCSKGNQGWICPAIHEPVPTPGLIKSSITMMLKKDSPLYIKPRAAVKLAPWLQKFMRKCNIKDYAKGEEILLTLSRPTLQLFDELERDLNFELHKNGFLFVFLHEKTLDNKYKRLLRGAKQYGHEYPKLLTKKEVLKREPSLSEDIVGGIYLANQYHVRPESLSRALIHYLKERDVDMYSKTEIRSIEQERGSITAAYSESEKFTSDMFILASGTFSSHLTEQLGYAFPMTAGKGYSVTYTNPNFTFNQPIYLGDDSGGVTPFTNAIRIGGTMELSGVNTNLDEKRLKNIYRSSQKYFNESLNAELKEEWVGMRPMTPDGLPVIGKIPGIENGFIASGHGMVGVAMSPITGKIISEIVKGKTPKYPIEAVSPNRFM